MRLHLLSSIKFPTLEDCKQSIAQYDLLIKDNIRAAYQTYNKPPEENCLKYKRRSYQPVPKFLIDLFRRGKLTQLLMAAICFCEVDHRIAIEDIKCPWCHLIGQPIRAISYGIISGMSGVTEHQRCKGTVHDFQDFLVETDIPYQFWGSSVAILELQYQSKVKGCGESIILDAVNSKVDFKKHIPKELWFFYHVCCFWYSAAKADKNLKNALLKAIILCVMKNTTSSKFHTSDLPLILDPPVVRALSQWQSVYYDLLCLNRLLLEPLPPMQISQTINCSTIITLYEFITNNGNGDQTIICKMELGDDCKKVFDILFNLITG